MEASRISPLGTMILYRGPDDDPSQPLIRGRLVQVQKCFVDGLNKRLNDSGFSSTLMREGRRIRRDAVRLRLLNGSEVTLIWPNPRIPSSFETRGPDIMEAGNSHRLMTSDRIGSPTQQPLEHSSVTQLLLQDSGTADEEAGQRLSCEQAPRDIDSLFDFDLGNESLFPSSVIPSVLRPGVETGGVKVGEIRSSASPWASGTNDTGDDSELVDSMLNASLFSDLRRIIDGASEGQNSPGADMDLDLALTEDEDEGGETMGETVAGDQVAGAGTGTEHIQDLDAERNRYFARLRRRGVMMKVVRGGLNVDNEGTGGTPTTGRRFF